MTATYRRAALGAVVLALLCLVIAALALAGLGGARGFVLRNVSARVGRPVHLDGAMSFQPGLAGFNVRFAGLRVDQPAWAGSGAMVRVDHGLVRLPWTALLGDGRLEDVELDGVRIALERDATGRENWSDGRTGKSPRPPSIARIAIRDGRLGYRDLGRAITFDGALSAGAVQDSAPVFTLDGGGRVAGDAWTGRLSSTTKIGGPNAYALEGDLNLASPGGGSTAHFLGRLATFGGQRLDGRLEASGPDLHAFAQLTNLPLPRTPNYRLSTHLIARARRVQLLALTGRVGASDLAGALTLTPAPGGRAIHGEIKSQSLRISDLFAVVSGGQLTRGPRGDGWLPAVTINATPLRKLSGEIRFSAESVQAPTTPTIRSLQVRATFDRGLVAADPMTLDLAHGQATIRFRLDVRPATPRIGLDVALRGSDTADFVKTAATPPLQASFDGDIHLQGDGASFAQAAGASSGLVGLRLIHGRVQPVQAAVLSANLTGGAGALLGRSAGEVGVSCAAGRFQVSDGVGRATHLIIVTDMGAVSGAGGFNLGAGTIDLALRPLGSMKPDLTAVTLSGPLLHPHVALGLDAPAAVFRSALSGVLHPDSALRPAPAGCR